MLLSTQSQTPIQSGNMVPIAEILSLTLALAVVAILFAPVTRADYTAAVVEHAVISWLLPTINRDQAKTIINLNLDVFDLYTADAASTGADIIVFPEYGITGFVHEERDYILPFLETVPNPLDVLPKNYVPCHRTETTNITIQYRLSCMALKHNITVVANLMTVYYCDSRTDPDCPNDGRYQHNTDVAFGSGGQLLARYHKENLYTGEKVIYDPGHNQTKVAAFNTSFGSFGLFTCFDMLFANPAERLVDQLGVDTMIFPTAWMNELPLLSAVEYQQAWSLSFGVNLLAANIHYPFVQMTGSGIYSPESGAIAYHYEMNSILGKMLVGRVKNSVTHPRVSSARDVNYSSRQHVESFPVKKEQRGSKTDQAGINGGISSSLLSGMSQKQVLDRKRNVATPEANAVPTHFSKDKFISRSMTKYFTAELNDDLYNLTLLEGTQGHTSVSYGNITCEVKFERNSDRELYALGAFDGLHTMNGNYYVQSCALVCCASYTDPNRCGGEISNASTVLTFDLSMKGQSKGARLFPEVVTSGVRLPRPKKEWDFSTMRDRVWSHEGVLKEPLIAANIFGRLYRED